MSHLLAIGFFLLWREEMGLVESNLWEDYKSVGLAGMTRWLLGEILSTMTVHGA